MSEKPRGMIDVGEKRQTRRFARARAIVVLDEAIVERIEGDTLPKGNVLEFARVAGILAAKKTPSLLPLCHPLPVEQVTVSFVLGKDRVTLTTTARTTGKTGVEMEALMAAQVAALTIYDMCKMFSKEIEITGVRLLEKAGGKSGHYLWSEDDGV